MNTKWSVLLALTAVASSAFAQQGPPLGRPPQGRRGGRSASQTTVATETVRLVSLRRVQTDLRLSINQLTLVGAAVRSLSPATTEDQALAAVSKVLLPAQAGRLRELLVQDLGYGSLALADVRAQLAPTEEQAKAMAALLSTLETTKRALATADPAAAQRAAAELQAKTNAALAKLLTAEQDKKLRSLAGRALG